jgi:hypothetical protein
MVLLLSGAFITILEVVTLFPVFAVVDLALSRERKRRKFLAADQMSLLCEEEVENNVDVMLGRACEAEPW